MVTRVEVIERGKGKAYSNSELKGAYVDIQDKGRTIKVFINENPAELPRSDEVG